MNSLKEIISRNFLSVLLKEVRATILLVLAIVLAYIYLMQYIDHAQQWVPYMIVLFALLKAFYFTFFTFSQINKSIDSCRSFSQLLWTFGLLVFVVAFSFATDFACLSEFDSDAFSHPLGSADLNYLEKLFEYFYFSMVTFASIGYGDVVPVTNFAKLLVMIEIGQSFVLVVFGLSNINNIQSRIKNNQDRNA